MEDVRVVLFILLFLINDFVSVSAVRTRTKDEAKDVRVVCGKEGDSSGRIALSKTRFSVFPVRCVGGSRLI